MTKLLLSSITLFVLLASVAPQSTVFDKVSVGWYGVVDVDFGATYRQQNPLEDNPQDVQSLLPVMRLAFHLMVPSSLHYTCIAPCTANVNDTTFVSTVDTTCNNTYRGNTTVQLAKCDCMELKHKRCYS